MDFYSKIDTDGFYTDRGFRNESVSLQKETSQRLIDATLFASLQPELSFCDGVYTYKIKVGIIGIGYNPREAMESFMLNYNYGFMPFNYDVYSKRKKSFRAIKANDRSTVWLMEHVQPDGSILLSEECSNKKLIHPIWNKLGLVVSVDTKHEKYGPLCMVPIRNNEEIVLSQDEKEKTAQQSPD